MTPNLKVTGNNESVSRRYRFCQIFAWGLSSVVVVIAVVAWGSHISWHLSTLNSYQVFPLLGLLAFSIMWSHYVAYLLRRLLGLKPQALSQYFKITSFAVLALICLHPGLLIYQLFRDGSGLPPGSYEHYVAPGLAWVTLLGTASLLVFLAYELRRKFGKKPWWQYVQILNDVAMLAIVYHALRLGRDVQAGWFHGMWLFYGSVLVLVMGYNYLKKYTTVLTPRR